MSEQTVRQHEQGTIADESDVDSVAVEDDGVEEVLVEEVSIDGMCGVY